MNTNNKNFLAAQIISKQSEINITLTRPAKPCIKHVKIRISHIFIETLFETLL